MVKRITSVDTSKAGKKYATDIKGNPMFARTPALTELLAEGMFANVVEQLQTKTTDANNNLVDLPVEQHRPLHIITSVFTTKQAAIEALAEEGLFDAEVEEYTSSQRAAIASKYKLSSVKDLEAATA